MAAGAGAGLVSSFVTCPLDVIKTRLQAQHLSRDAAEYEGVRETVKRIWRQAGLRGFYRGLGPTLGGYLPTWGIYFTVYDMVKDRLGGWAEDHEMEVGTWVHVIAAMSAGATGTIMTNPLWVVKTRFMAQAVLPPSAARYRNTLDAVVTIRRTEGLGAFYKGLLPSLLGISHVAVQFPLYEAAKSYADSHSNRNDLTSNPDYSNLPASTILACSAFSKMVASLVTYPHEVLRTRLQIRKSIPSISLSSSSSSSSGGGVNNVSNIVRIPISTPTPLYSPLISAVGGNPPIPIGPGPEYTRIAAPKGSKWERREGGVIDTFLSIKKQDGWRGFYRGLSINLVRTVPNSAVTMLT
ncbi:solute carrier family 25 (mitochondrial folate transporter), member 32 [Tremella mesenterica]|uniref:Solute carrier family 25 (Mitochondrial folate transporter), member 32 n=1 Tax=Tremella mesenterica TaxID=5217 RepID=A0A4Q1BV11_TREME|nr:solute carrier family 25 (mitochondrial folate transporter), member 32 [Tremella mesenterica]